MDKDYAGERLAVVVIGPDVAGDAVRLIADHGLRIECSLEGFRPHLAEVVLVISGHQLPEQCGAGGEPTVVQLTCTTEIYGSQKISRISAIEIDWPLTQDFREARGIAKAGKLG
jgi:hypothetical protein